MGPAGQPQFSKDFDLDSSILGVTSATKISVGVSTDINVFNAIKDDTAFPTGDIALGNISVNVTAGRDLTFDAGQAKVGFTAAAGAGTGIGIFDKPADAVASLKLPATPGLDLAVDGGAASRYLVMSWRYHLSGSVTASHPIGAIGSASATVSGSRAAIYAVVHAFPPAAGASSTIKDTVDSWRLPRNVGEETTLRMKPRTWLVAEVDASFALGLSAQLGYNFTLMHELRVLGLTREVGAKIDAGLKATFGFSVDDTFLVVLGRESDKESSGDLRLRLFKQADRQVDFGVNLTVGVQGQVPLPNTIHDLVKAVFGVQGQQVVKDLEILEKWTDPNADLGANIAGLINSTGLELLTKTTGIDARTEFNKARGIVLDALAKWKALPDQLSGVVWKLIGDQDATAAADLKSALTLLADPNPANIRTNLANMIGTAVFGDSPIAKWLTAIADKGLVSLSSEIDTVHNLAVQTLGILNGDVIRKLQGFIDEKLNLDKLTKVVTQSDFDSLDGWLVKRLSNFLNESLEFSKLKPVQDAIHAVLAKSEEIYEKAVAALNGKYTFNFAASYSSATSSTALLDVVFDFNNPAARGLLKSVLTDGDLKQLLLHHVDGVTLNQAALTHSINQTGVTQVHMPMVDFVSTHVTDSLAKLTVKDDGGRILLYELNATDTVTVKARYQSQLSALASLRVKDGVLVIGPGDGNSLRYTDRQVRKNITFDEIQSRTGDFAKRFLGSAVGGDDASANRFYQTQLRGQVGTALGSADGKLGDGLIDLELSYPGSILNPWFITRDPATVKASASAMSLVLQAAFRQHLCRYYFRDIDRLKAIDAAAPLLVWASMPVSTAIADDNGTLKFSTEKGIFWEFESKNLRQAVAQDGHTLAGMKRQLAAARTALLAAGETHTSAFYEENQAGKRISEALNTFGDGLLAALLRTESGILVAAVSALSDIQRVLATLNTDPAQAVLRFSQFGADLTNAFHGKVASTYGDDSLRTLGPVLLISAAQALDSESVAPTPDALMSFALLKAGHAFVLGDFVDGKKPDSKEVAFSKTLVSTAPLVAGAGQ